MPPSSHCVVTGESGTRRVLIALSAMVMLLVLFAAAPAKAHGPVVGKAHAAWWKWALSFPLSNHPLDPAKHLPCSYGQRGNVWFLGGVVNAGGTVVRDDCTIPRWTTLVVAVANVECSTLEPPPFFGGNERELRHCANGVVRRGDPLEITRQFARLDGHPLSVPRAESPLFRFRVTSESDNILSCAPSCADKEGESVADGYLLVLWPLRPGRHTLRFGGTFPAADFTLDITYEITVPRHRP